MDYYRYYCNTHKKMKRIIVKAITEKGEYAIKQYIDECKNVQKKNPIKIKLIEKIKKKFGIREEYYENPYIIEVLLEKEYYNIEQPTILKIEEILKKYGSNNTRDYIIEVYNE